MGLVAHLAVVVDACAGVYNAAFAQGGVRVNDGAGHDHRAFSNGHAARDGGVGVVMLCGGAREYSFSFILGFFLFC